MKFQRINAYGGPNWAVTDKELANAQCAQVTILTEGLVEGLREEVNVLKMIVGIIISKLPPGERIGLARELGWCPADKD